MSAAIKTQDRLASVKQFNCTNCGAALEVLNPRAREISCQYCGSLLDVTSEEHQILRALVPPKKHPPMSFIRLGQTAVIDGQQHQVIARTRWRMKYKEYWYEEGESGYSDEVWVYDEWLLMNQDFTYFYLVEDREGFHQVEEIIPETPSLLPKDRRMRFYNNQRKQIVREYGQASVIFFEGESNYRIQLGDTIKFAMFQERRIKYQAEWRLDKQGEIKEVEFFKEVPLSRRKVQEAFSSNAEVQTLMQREADWKFVFRVAQFTFIALLLMAMYSMLSDGTPIFSQEVQAATLANDNTQVVGPIEIPEKGLYCLKITALGMPANTEMNVGAYILNQDSVAVNTLVQNFYYYTGTDSDGTWTESDNVVSKVFRLSGGGTYYLQLYLDSQYTNMGTLRIELNKGVWLTRYFIIGLVICLIPLMVSWLKKGSA
ncbi:MAG: hypothetical protein D6730_07335 [Bacteroidetes bacterium]|nr:MAG: hypothetical protein D6730_07335 [Bacteroidota bacterium]